MFLNIIVKKEFRDAAMILYGLETITPVDSSGSFYYTTFEGPK